LHSEELHNFYFLLNIIGVMKSRRIGWAGYVARMEDMKRAYAIFVGKPEGTKPLGRRLRWRIILELSLDK